MKRMAKWIIKVMVAEGIVDKEEADVYEYGLQIFLELLLCLGTCFFVAFSFHVFLEMALFFLIFIPLRSYAGGLHLESFWSCYLLSCLTFSGVIVAAKCIELSFAVSIPAIVLLLLSVYFMYPVENANREVDSDEDRYFRNKLLQFLFLDGVIVIIFFALSKKEYIQIIMLTFGTVVFTMMLGKYKNKVNK